MGAVPACPRLLGSDRPQQATEHRVRGDARTGCGGDWRIGARLARLFGAAPGTVGPGQRVVLLVASMPLPGGGRARRWQSRNDQLIGG